LNELSDLIITLDTFLRICQLQQTISFMISDFVFPPVMANGNLWTIPGPYQIGFAWGS